jgi:hypothetical protein
MTCCSFASNSLQPAFPELQHDWSIPETVVALTSKWFIRHIPTLAHKPFSNAIFVCNWHRTTLACFLVGKVG